MNELYGPLKQIIEEAYADGATEESLVKGAEALDKYQVQHKKGFKSAVIQGTIYFLLALGCIIGQGYVSDIWHEAMLLIAGIFLGGVAAMIVLITYADMRKKDSDKHQNSQISDPGRS